MKNIANADRPKSVGAMLPPRPFRGSGKVAQTACNSDRREGKSCIPTVNQTFADSRILKISKFRTFRIAGRRQVDVDEIRVTAVQAKGRWARGDLRRVGDALKLDAVDDICGQGPAAAGIAQREALIE